MRWLPYRLPGGHSSHLVRRRVPIEGDPKRDDAHHEHQQHHEDQGELDDNGTTPNSPTRPRPMPWSQSATAITSTLPPSPTTRTLPLRETLAREGGTATIPRNTPRSEIVDAGDRSVKEQSPIAQWTSHSTTAASATPQPLHVVIRRAFFPAGAGSRSVHPPVARMGASCRMDRHPGLCRATTGTLASVPRCVEYGTPGWDLAMLSNGWRRATRTSTQSSARGQPATGFGLVSP